eukprot:FR740128.1.p1 GENE.FR740128.1~~FR740128.1.p1  ORF type:complete len:322 (+),score=33.05 FR740128.1:77-967(+)
MTLLMDEAIKNMTSALATHGLYDSTLIIIASDNGANPMVSAAGSNWPLRGVKGWLWEGGLRVNAVVRSHKIPIEVRGSTYDGLFHVTDWMPTIFEFLNASDVLADSQLDGLSHWSAILDQSVSPRHSLLYNIDYRYNVTTAALRVGDMKLHRNAQLQPIYSIPQTNNLTVDMSHYENTEYVDYLFNLTADPTESHDLKDAHPDIFHAMNRALDQYEVTMEPTAFCGAADDVAAVAVFHETPFIGPWMDDTDFQCPVINDMSSMAHQEHLDYSVLPLRGCFPAPRALPLPSPEHGLG